MYNLPLLNGSDGDQSDKYPFFYEAFFIIISLPDILIDLLV